MRPDVADVQRTSRHIDFAVGFRQVRDWDLKVVWLSVWVDQEDCNAIDSLERLGPCLEGFLVRTPCRISGFNAKAEAAIQRHGKSLLGSVEMKQIVGFTGATIHPDDGTSAVHIDAMLARHLRELERCLVVAEDLCRAGCVAIGKDQTASTSLKPRTLLHQAAAARRFDGSVPVGERGERPALLFESRVDSVALSCSRKPASTFMHVYVCVCACKKDTYKLSMRFKKRREGGQGGAHAR